MGRTKRSKNQKTSQKQPSAAAAAAASAAKEKQPSAAAAAAASAAKDPRFSIGDRIGVTSIDRGPVGVYRWAKIVKAYQGGGAFHFHIEWQDDYRLYKAANIEQCLTEKEMRDMEARKTKRPRDKKNAQSSSKKSKSTNDTGPMHPHQTWPCSQPMMDAYGKKEQLLATQEMQEFGLKALKKTQREIATAQKKKDAAAVAAHVERQQVTKEKLARYEIAEAHYENWKADNQTVVAFLESLVMNEATRPTVQQAAVVVRADYEAQKTECAAANVAGQHAWSVPDRPEGSPLQTLVQLWRGAGMSSGDDQRSLADFLDATHVYALGCILSKALCLFGQKARFSRPAVRGRPRNHSPGSINRRNCPIRAVCQARPRPGPRQHHRWVVPRHSRQASHVPVKKLHLAAKEHHYRTRHRYLKLQPRPDGVRPGV